MTKPATNSTVTSAPSNDAGIPLLDLGRQYSSIREEVLAAIERVCASQHFVLGAEGAAFEKEIAEFCGAQAAVACASGTDALWLALVAIGVQPGDAVLTTSFSFFASASAIARAGARPILVDIEPSSFNIDPNRVEAFLRNNTAYKVRALLPVHLYGQCADMTALERVAAEFDLSIVEDAAQGIGAEWKRRRAGSFGMAAAFSFYPTKNLSAYGDAGLMTTGDPEIAARMRRLRNHGSPKRYLHEEFGWNSRLDEIQAAILRVKLPHVTRWNEQRREHAATYGRLIREAGLVGNEDGAEPSKTRPVVLPRTSPGAHHVFHQYVIRAERRDALRQHLAEHSIGTEIYYPIPLHLQPCLAYLGYREGDLPQSERASQQVLALPMFPELTEDEQRRVVARIAEFYSQAGKRQHHYL